MMKLHLVLSVPGHSDREINLEVKKDGVMVDAKHRMGPFLLRPRDTCNLNYPEAKLHIEHKEEE